MGEMADAALDDMLDDWEAWTDFAIGGMSIDEAYERGIVDELGYETLSSNNVARLSTCKYCDSDNVYWLKKDDKWRLHDVGSGVPHVCDSYVREG